MDEIQQLKSDARRADEARRVIQSQAFMDAFEALRKDLQRQMSVVKSTDEATKSKLIDMWQLVDGFEKWFVKAIETGDYAAIQLEEKKKLKIFG